MLYIRIMQSCEGNSELVECATRLIEEVLLAWFREFLFDSKIPVSALVYFSGVTQLKEIWE